MPESGTVSEQSVEVDKSVGVDTNVESSPPGAPVVGPEEEQAPHVRRHTPESCIHPCTQPTLRGVYQDKYTILESKRWCLMGGDYGVVPKGWCLQTWVVRVGIRQMNANSLAHVLVDSQ